LFSPQILHEEMVETAQSLCILNGVVKSSNITWGNGWNSTESIYWTELLSPQILHEEMVETAESLYIELSC